VTLSRVNLRRQSLRASRIPRLAGPPRSGCASQSREAPALGLGARNAGALRRPRALHDLPEPAVSFRTQRLRSCTTVEVAVGRKALSRPLSVDAA
jgi:hypothetical protein